MVWKITRRHVASRNGIRFFHLIYHVVKDHNPEYNDEFKEIIKDLSEKFDLRWSRDGGFDTSTTETMVKLLKHSGLLYPKETRASKKIEITPAGEELHEIITENCKDREFRIRRDEEEDDYYFEISPDREHFNELGEENELGEFLTSLLSRFQLNNPAQTRDDLRNGGSIHPFWALYKAFSELDYYLTGDEILRILYKADEDNEIGEKIQEIKEYREFLEQNPDASDEEKNEFGEKGEGQYGKDETYFLGNAGVDYGVIERDSGNPNRYDVDPSFHTHIDHIASSQPEIKHTDDVDEWMNYFGRRVLKEEIPKEVEAELNISESVEKQIKTRINEELVIPEKKLNSVISAIQAGNIILTGPPGTGKTKIAQILSETLTENNIINDDKFVTATADWSTFETIGGYIQNSDGALTFTPGHVLDALEIENSKWLVIDELNRADIDKAFGPLFSLLSGQKVELDYDSINIGTYEDYNGAEDYLLPKSWRIIATMNTFDKNSLFDLSYAFMRRFSFVNISVPDPEESWSDLIDTWEVETDERVKAIWSLANEEKSIGPSLARDMLKLTGKGYETSELVISCVLPQFEGENKKTIYNLIEKMAKDDAIDVEEDSLKEEARQFFNFRK